MSYYTEQGLEKLKTKLHELKTHQRKEVADQIAEAVSRGDLSENSEYKAAKEMQERLEIEIDKLEEIVSKARVIDENDIDLSKVAILTKVKIKNTKTTKVFTYTIVAEEEANLKLGKISVESPIGKGLLGKKIGDTAVVNVPAGKLNFEILEIGH